MMNECCSFDFEMNVRIPISTMQGKMHFLEQHYQLFILSYFT